MIVALWRAPGITVDDVLELVRNCTISVAVDDQPYARDPVDVLLHGDANFDVAPLGLLARRLERFDVETHVQRDGPASPGVTMVSFVHRAEFLTHDQFVDHWTNNHTPLALKHHIGLVRYVQHVVTGGGEIDGIAELTFATRNDYETKYYDDDAGKAIIREDVRKFIGARQPGTSLMHEVVGRR